MYLVYKHVSSILLVAITDKKTQQATINEVLLHFQECRKYIEVKLKEIT